MLCVQEFLFGWLIWVLLLFVCSFVCFVEEALEYVKSEREIYSIHVLSEFKRQERDTASVISVRLGCPELILRMACFVR